MEGLHGILLQLGPGEEASLQQQGMRPGQNLYLHADKLQTVRMCYDMYEIKCTQLLLVICNKICHMSVQSDSSSSTC